MNFVYTMRVYAEPGKAAIKSSKLFYPKIFLALKEDLVEKYSQNSVM